MNIAKSIVAGVFNKAGITVGGNEMWDINIHNEDFYSRVLTEGSLGLGESYMEGWWSCKRIDQFLERILENGVPWFANFNINNALLFIQSAFMNLAPKHKADEIAKKHYDWGNDLFRGMLGPPMTYSSGYDWENNNTLEKSQIAKVDLSCRKLLLMPGQEVLEYGCGWGSFAYHAVFHYDVSVVGLTVSEQQVIYARERCKYLPVKILLTDYRDFYMQADHIVSIGMREHVDPRDARIYMEVAKRCLKPEGIFLLHTIGSPDLVHTPDPWIKKYIFPIGEIPTRRQIIKSTEGLFEIRDWHTFEREDYARTLMAWHDNLVAAWPDLEEKYGHHEGGKFFLMLRFYLLACAAFFRLGKLELWQLVLSHPDKYQNYQPVR